MPKKMKPAWGQTWAMGQARTPGQGGLPPSSRGSSREQPSPRSTSLPAPAQHPAPASAPSRELRPSSTAALLLFLLLLLLLAPTKPGPADRGAGGTPSCQPQRGGGKGEEETGRARGTGARQLPARAVAVPWSQQGGTQGQWGDTGAMGGRRGDGQGNGAGTAASGTTSTSRRDPSSSGASGAAVGLFPSRQPPAFGSAADRFAAWDGDLAHAAEQRSCAWVCALGGQLRRRVWCQEVSVERALSARGSCTAALSLAAPAPASRGLWERPRAEVPQSGFGAAELPLQQSELGSRLSSWGAAGRP